MVIFTTPPGHVRRLFLGLVLLSGLGSASLPALEPLQRAKDLHYGRVLYAYHQGQAFEALSLMSAAELKGGIKGHGEHPKLLEGGMLLAYGMVQEAKTLFEAMLKEQLSVDHRNIAWFYLGKVFYLQQNAPQAISSFRKIDAQALKTAAPERYYELLYLKGQMAGELSPQEAGLWQSELPQTHIFRFYLRYNQALGLLADKQDQAIETLQILRDDLRQQLMLEKTQALTAHDFQSTQSTPSQSSRSEISAAELPMPEIRTPEISAVQEYRALLDQTLLSLAQVQLQAEQSDAALESLKAIDKDGVFSSEALFLYALAASHLQRYQLALAALTELNERRHFNPWRQQSPYALAYLYEQMTEPGLALEAYRAAVGHYEALQSKLQAERDTLNEDSALAALGLSNRIGQANLLTDAYGRIQADASAFNFATLLATERFQTLLSELHELYVLQNALETWQRQLDSFDVMLETRQQARLAKLQALQAQLQATDAASWQAKATGFETQIAQALADENAHYFMSEEQLAYYQRIQKTITRLQALPDTHPDKANYQARLERIQAYFNWWIADEFTVNRWRTVKQQKQLEEEMAQFQERFASLEGQQNVDAAHADFTERLAQGRQRLALLQQELVKALDRSRSQIVAALDQAMQQQLAEIADYLLASREALARVSDQLLSQSNIGQASELSKEQAQPEEGEAQREGESQPGGEREPESGAQPEAEEQSAGEKQTERSDTP